jgi:hypothetical protein
MLFVCKVSTVAHHKRPCLTMEGVRMRTVLVEYDNRKLGGYTWLEANACRELMQFVLS